MASGCRNLCRTDKRLTYNTVEKARILGARICPTSMANEQGTSVSHQYTGTCGPIQEEKLHFAGFGVYQPVNTDATLRLCGCLLNSAVDWSYNREPKSNEFTKPSFRV